MKQRGRHVNDPLEDREVNAAGLKDTPIEGEKLQVFLQFGDARTGRWQRRVDTVHVYEAAPLTEQIAGITSVQLHAAGDGSSYLQVCGFEPEEVHQQWLRAVQLIGGFEIVPVGPLEPASTEAEPSSVDQLVCIHCQGWLFKNHSTGPDPDRFVWQHENGSIYCPPFETADSSEATNIIPIDLLSRLDPEQTETMTAVVNETLVHPAVPKEDA